MGHFDQGVMDGKEGERGANFKSKPQRPTLLSSFVLKTNMGGNEPETRYRSSLPELKKEK